MVGDGPNWAALSQHGIANFELEEPERGLSQCLVSQPIKKMKMENNGNTIPDQTSSGLTRSAQYAGVPGCSDENGLLGTKREWGKVESAGE